MPVSRRSRSVPAPASAHGLSQSFEQVTLSASVSPSPCSNVISSSPSPRVASDLGETVPNVARPPSALGPSLVDRPLPGGYRLPPSPPSPGLDLVEAWLDPNPTNPHALPLPSPPREGEYIFPDPTGRASRLPPCSQPSRVFVETLPSSPPSDLDDRSRLARTPPTTTAHAPPSAPKLEPTRNLAPSPPSGRLSSFAGSPVPVSPNFELGGPLLEWHPVTFGPHGVGLSDKAQKHLVSELARGGTGQRRGRGGGGGRSSHHSPSPLRGGGRRDAADEAERELAQAYDKIHQLENEVAALRRELIDRRATPSLRFKNPK
ncbi:hypothetical protein JCM3766R1_001622 [Sporobolomyces carnicolor]